MNYSKKLVGTARHLRRNMTDEEKHLWYDFLRKLPVNVYRQKNIGNYIVDFYVASCKCVIEIDGRQHSMKENRASDAKRDEELGKMGVTVLRYTNQSINSNFTWVCSDILKKIGIEASRMKK